VNGTPLVDAHIGLPISKITAGVVSVEAGFDRGYLKSSRASHQILLSQIKSSRAEEKSNKFEHNIIGIKKAKMKILKLERENKLLAQQRDAVISQNLHLYETLISLEAELSRLQPRIG
jgi:hypothetical protein